MSNIIRNSIEKIKQDGFVEFARSVPRYIKYQIIHKKSFPSWKVLEWASLIGLGKSTVDAYHWLINYPEKKPEIESNMDKYNDINKNSYILMPITTGMWEKHLYMYAVFAHGFRDRGYEPIILVCDGSLPICRPKEELDSDAMCDLCNRCLTTYIEDFGLEYRAFSDVLPDSYTNPSISADDIDNIEYKDIDISKYAKASARRFLKKYNINFNDDEEREIYLRFLQSAKKHVDVGEQLFSTHEIDTVVASDAVYNESGIYLAISAAHDTPAYDAKFGKKPGHVELGNATENRLPFGYYTDANIVEERLSRPLTDEQRAEIDQFMSRRMFNNSATTHDFSREANLDKEEYDETIGMFTNLIWDGSLEVEDAPFPNVFDWIYSTIDYYLEQEDTQLIIRTHPAEVTKGTNESVSKSIQDKYPELPDNIEIIEPDSNIDTYSLFEYLDGAVVYNSTVGIEMAYTGIPVILGGDTHYRGHELTYDPSSPNDYMELLNGLPELHVSSDMKKRAIRYAHLFFISKQIEFPGVDEKEIQISEILQNENLIFLIDSVLGGEPVLK